MNMSITPNFSLPEIKCKCYRCKDDNINHMDTSILWVAETIRAYLNYESLGNGKILFIVNSGCRCRQHHIEIYNKMGIYGNKIPMDSRHIIRKNKKVDALDIKPIYKSDPRNKEAMAGIIEYIDGWLDKKFPGGYHAYIDKHFFHIDLGRKRRWR